MSSRFPQLVGQLAAIGTALVAAGAAARAETIAIRDATIYPEPSRKFDRATVIVRDGRIAEIGANAQIPSGAQVIDGSGLVVTSGLIDAYTRLGLVEVQAVASTVEGQFAAAGADQDVVHAAYQVIDGYNPSSVAIPITRAGGVTAAVAVPGGGLIAGSSAWMSLKDAVVADEVAIKHPLAMHATLGEQATGAGAGSRGMALERLRELFDDAAQYGKRRASYERNQTRRFAAARLDLEALLPVLRREIPLVVYADRASDIGAAMRFARERQLKLVIAGAAEAWRLAPALARDGVAVMLDPTRNLPASFDQTQVRDDAPALLANAGVPVILSTLGDGSQVRTLRQLAGVAVGMGMAWDQALAAITTVPAQTFGLAPRGQLRPGAPADLVVWTGDPLELSSRPVRVLIAGVEQSLTSRQSQLLKRYLRLSDPAGEAARAAARPSTAQN
jgi:imidazolonepropionase-like amidohydrolase